LFLALKFLQNLPLLDAIKKTLTRLEGTWGIAVIAKEHPDQMIAVCTQFYEFTPVRQIAKG
jgi:glucosamine 6-phosphate synthetase-like amidotransferase/phosphosugar isomerase protein